MSAALSPTNGDSLQNSVGPHANADLPSAGAAEESLTPLEREVLEEYVKLRENLDQVTHSHVR